MTRSILGFLAFLCLAPAAFANSPLPYAPDFTATDVTGKPFTLSEHKGKIVVLEWTNPECPFVKKHYVPGNMQAVQKTALEKGAVWVSINSSAPGKEGAITAEEAKAWLEEHKATPTAYILDSKGDIGRLYEAKTTPHMFVIAEDGTLAYRGAIDDNDSANSATIAGAKNYVLAALDDLIAGRPVAVPETRAYGCGVKY